MGLHEEKIMAIEDKNDKQILNLLENNADLRAIKVDFKDLNNKTLIIKSSFVEAYKKLEELKENWFYIGNLGFNGINLVGIVNMIPDQNNYLHLFWIETNKIFKKKGYSKEIVEYLKRYSQFAHFKGIIVHCEKAEDMHLFKFNDFKPKGNNSLEMIWLNQ